MTAIPFQREIVYPESDGQPMAESDLHRKEMTYLIEALTEHFRRADEVYVAGNLFFYYKKGDPRSVVAPDLFVVKGVAKRDRKVYKLWEEHRSPCFVVEVTSDTTRDEDLSDKLTVYEHLGVEEYFLFDPLGDYLDPRLQGHRLVNGSYQPAPLERDGSLVSRTANVTFRVEGEHLRLTEASSGAPLLRYEEYAARARQAEARAADLEREVARLQAELERLRKTD
ncbi:MAG TPA: Uma2 family endonuclease [Thermoanaerobaculia bacterium]|jgi:Uma2 family endonuclease